MKTESYWQASAQMPGFPSLSANLEADVVVVGAGLTGITTAWLLKGAGAKVVLLDRKGCAQADTGHTTAHLTYVTDKRLNELVRHFGRDAAKAFWEAGIAAIDQIYEISQSTARDSEFRWVTGYLHSSEQSPNAKERESLEKDAQLASELGFNAEFVEKVPLAKCPGVRFPSQAKFHPYKYLAALLKEIPGNGSHVFQDTEVSEIEDEPTVIHAGRHKLKCSYVVIATHNPLLGKTGMLKGTLFQSKLALYTSYVIGAKLPRESLPEALFWDTSDPYYYLRVDRHSDHDYAIFGGEDCKTGQEDDANLVLGRLAKELKRRLPDAEFQHRWLGQVVETDDGLPFIGENDGRQFIATGFCGNGFTLGTLAAVMARDRFLGRQNPWFDLFAVNRKQYHGGTWRYLKENFDYPFYFVRDRLAGSEGDSLGELKTGEGKILRLNGRKVAAFRDAEGGVMLNSPVCTHLGCIVRWNSADRTWDCPCHGSRFKPDGSVFSGPAESPLEKVQEKDENARK